MAQGHTDKAKLHLNPGLTDSRAVHLQHALLPYKYSLSLQFKNKKLETYFILNKVKQ